MVDRPPSDRTPTTGFQTTTAHPNGAAFGASPASPTPITPISDASSPAHAPAVIGTFHALRFRNYRLLWLGNTFSSAAMWIQQTTMGWVVYDLTGSGSILGAVNGVRGIPSLLVSPFAGVVTDRMSRKAVISVSQVGLFLVTALLALGLALHRVAVWHLFLFAILVSLGNSFNMPARQTLVFDLVPRNVVANAVALSNLAFSLARALGPMVGGALLVAFGPANNFMVQSLAYLGVMATVLMVRLPPRERSRERRSVFRDMAEGYGYAARTPQTRLLLLMMVISPLFLIPLHLALLPIFTKDVFRMNASGLGILLASLGIGGLLGGLLTASLNSVDRRGLLQFIALFVYSLAQASFSVVALLTGSLWWSVGFLVLAGAAEAVFGSTNQTVLQLVAPDHLRGRITAIFQIQPVLISLGVFAAGAAADVFGAPAVGTALALTAFMIGLAVLLFSPRMRNLRLSRLGDTEADGARRRPTAA